MIQNQKKEFATVQLNNPTNVGIISVLSITGMALCLIWALIASVWGTASQPQPVIELGIHQQWFKQLHTGWPSRSGLCWLSFWEFPRLGGHFHSYLLPKQNDGTSQPYYNQTQVRDPLGHPVEIKFQTWYHSWFPKSVKSRWTTSYLSSLLLTWRRTASWSLCRAPRRGPWCRAASTRRARAACTTRPRGPRARRTAGTQRTCRSAPTGSPGSAKKLLRN